jgi:hypothetical protein
MVESFSTPTKIQTAIKPSCRGLVRPRASISPKLVVALTPPNQDNHKLRINNGPSDLGAFILLHPRDMEKSMSTMASDPRPRHVTPFALRKRLAMKPRSQPASLFLSLGSNSRPDLGAELGGNILPDLGVESFSTKSRHAAFLQDDSPFMTPKQGLFNEEYPSLPPRCHKTSKDNLLSVPRSTPCRLLIPDDF